MEVSANERLSLDPWEVTLCKLLRITCRKVYGGVNSKGVKYKEQ